MTEAIFCDIFYLELRNENISLRFFKHHRNIKMRDDIIQKVEDFVDGECKKPSSKYGYDPFLFHFKPVVEYAGMLSDKLGGDKEVIIIASWMHDIGSIIHGRKDHHITGARIAEEKLREWRYPEEKIKLVRKCVLNHRGSQRNLCESIEEKIVAESDILSNFEKIEGLFRAAFIYEKLGQKEARESVKKKLENKWNQLHFDRSREIVRPKYEAAMLLLG